LNGFLNAVRRTPQVCNEDSRRTIFVCPS